MAEIQSFLNQIPIVGHFSWLIALGILGLIVGWMVTKVLKRRKAVPAEEAEEIIEVDELVYEELEEYLDEEQKQSISSETIARFFLKIFKAQLGESQDALAEIKQLTLDSIAPTMTYEMRVAHNRKWETRRMTVGPLGEEGTSRSQCFTVIYDDHLVLKIPQKPIKKFNSYIDNILSDQEIVKKLAPRECIVPSVSAILRRVHPFSDADTLIPIELEKKYIDWLIKFPTFQDYLKIDESFIFVMDLSRYFFLGHITNDLHDLNNRLYQEIVGYPAVIWENHGFEGRYGFENDEAVDGIKDVFSRYEETVRLLLKDLDRTNSVDTYALQKWFLVHLAGRELESAEKGLSTEIVDKLNQLIQKILEDNKNAVEDYRNTIRGCIQSVTVAQNKSQMGGIITNILDLLVWLRGRGIAMRDLKPDNLLIVGDTSKYPDFLKSAGDYTVGLIDVETAVEYKPNNTEEIEQPILGGTPSYATPAHLCDNQALRSLLGGVSRILYLQDWYAAVGMIYEVILGECLFDQTGKLLVGIKNLVLKSVKEKQEFYEAFKKASQMFWFTAVDEFKSKTSQKEEHLQSVEVDVPDQARDMLRKELLKGKQITAGRIKRYVNNQAAFKEEKLCQGLICASRQKISELKAKLTKDLGNPKKLSKEKTLAIKVLTDLEQLKLQSENLLRLIKELGKPNLIINAHELIELMFDIILQAMYLEEWGELSAAEGIQLEDVAGATTIEATV
jgi:serine/threonine protein kinase